MNSKSLVAQLTEWSIAYYQGKPLVSDPYFDDMVEKLREMAPSHPLLTTTAWGATAPDWDVPHWSHVAGLNQYKIEQLEEVFQYWGRKSVKLDGLTGVLRYSADGQLLDGLTRGDGDNGKDITTTAIATGKVPTQIANHAEEPIQIRGEFVLSWKNFGLMVEKGLCREDTHPRNVAAGCINGSDLEKAAYVDFVAFSVCDANGNPLPDAKEVCEELGVDWIDDEPFISVPQMQKVWDDCWKGSMFKYPTDGIVLTNEDGTAEWKVKFPSEDVQEMVVGSIEMRKTRTGRIIPHCTFKEPKFISGCWINHCTLNNVTWCRSAFDLPIWEGARVMVRRANEIIPEIVTVIEGVQVPSNDGLAFRAGLTPEDVFMEGTDLRFESEDWRVAQTLERILGTALTKGYGGSLTDPVWASIKREAGIVDGIEDAPTLKDFGHWLNRIRDAAHYQRIVDGMALTPNLLLGFEAMVSNLVKPIDVATILHFCSIRGVGDSRLGDMTRTVLERVSCLLNPSDPNRVVFLEGMVPPAYSGVLAQLLDIYGAELNWEMPEWLKEPVAIDESTVKGRFSMTGKIAGMKKDELADKVKAAGWLWDDKAYDIMVSDADRMSSKMIAAQAAGKLVLTSAEFLDHVGI
jgi:hypothetical protein